MRLLKSVIGLTLAAALCSSGQLLFPGLLAWFDPFLVVVLFHSLERQPGWSMVEGCAAGLARDVLSGGLYGLHGIADTVVGFAAARLRQRLVIQRGIQVALMAALGAALQHALVAIVEAAFLPGGDGPDPLQAGVSMVSTGLACAGLYALTHRFGDWRRQRREQRRRRPTLESW